MTVSLRTALSLTSVNLKEFWMLKHPQFVFACDSRRCTIIIYYDNPPVDTGRLGSAGPHRSFICVHKRREVVKSQNIRA